jgi:hypothetical protein
MRGEYVISNVSDFPLLTAGVLSATEVLVSATALGSSKLTFSSSARNPTSRYLNATAGTDASLAPRMKTVTVVFPPG